MGVRGGYGLDLSGVKAQEQITIGVIQYDVRDIDKSFKALHEQGFGSCELNYSEKDSRRNWRSR